MKKYCKVCFEKVSNYEVHRKTEIHKYWKDQEKQINDFFNRYTQLSEYDYTIKNVLDKKLYNNDINLVNKIISYLPKRKRCSHCSLISRDVNKYNAFFYDKKQKVPLCDNCIKKKYKFCSEPECDMISLKKNNSERDMISLKKDNSYKFYNCYKCKKSYCKDHKEKLSVEKISEQNLCLNCLKEKHQEYEKNLLKMIIKNEDN